jgi:hypothetical protein
MAITSQPIALAASSVPTDDQFNAFLDRILGVYEMEAEIKGQIKETMQKLNIPDKIKFMADEGLQKQLIDIDTRIKTEYGKIKQYIDDKVWIEFLKNIIQLQVLVFLKKIPLNAIIKPFEDVLGQKIAALAEAKKTTALAETNKAMKNKYMIYKKKYLALK